MSIGEVDPSLVRLLLNLDRLGDARPQNGAINFKHALQEIGFEKHQEHLRFLNFKHALQEIRFEKPPKTLEKLRKP